jgi:hypothetical protein
MTALAEGTRKGSTAKLKARDSERDALGRIHPFLHGLFDHEKALPAKGTGLFAGGLLIMNEP